MIEYLNTHQYAFWFSIGFLLLILEALVFGFSSGVVLFAGIGGLITGGLMWADVVPATWLAGIAVFGVSSGASAVILWKPMLKLQEVNPPEKDNSSDLVGREFRLDGPVTRAAPGKTRYSGIEWRVEIDNSAEAEQIEAGRQVTVVSIDAGVFRVRPL